MFVCHCRGVTDGTVRHAIEAGARDLCSLAASCGAGSRCGGCHLALWQMLAETGVSDRVEATPLAPARAAPAAGATRATRAA